MEHFSCRVLHWILSLHKYLPATKISSSLCQDNYAAMHVFLLVQGCLSYTLTLSSPSYPKSLPSG